MIIKTYKEKENQTAWDQPEEVLLSYDDIVEKIKNIFKRINFEEGITYTEHDRFIIVSFGEDVPPSQVANGHAIIFSYGGIFERLRLIVDEWSYLSYDKVDELIEIIVYEEFEAFNSYTPPVTVGMGV